MKVSTRVEYGLIALTDIAIYSENGKTVSAPDISARESISHKYLEQILLLLRQAGFIAARKGLKGGYALSRPTDKITLTDVLNALDNGILAEMEGEYADDGLGPVINDCFWGKINNELKSYTDSLTLEHFVELCRNRTPESWDMYVI
ncbi:MAG: Rrf2 family transcriptional regulator [Lachnospiraceae bacterium]|nr:Rrf2 family transcriptional regulator [Lachnospiraceae bacterium]